MTHPLPPPSTRHVALVAGLSALVFVTAGLRADDKAKSEGTPDPALVLTGDERRLMDLINDVRTKADLKPLAPSARLFKIARAHSANMSKHNKLDHELDDKTPFQRMDEVGYTYSRAGENIAEATAGPLREVVDLWLNSPPHKKNILTPEFRETGVGIAPGADNIRWYTQDFGTPRGE